MSRFLNSLKQGNNGEQLVVDLFNLNGYTCVKNEGKKVEYDYTVTKLGSYKLEVKSDYMATQTGNIAIEYFNSKLNKPSGITATLADFWVHVLFNPSQIYIIRPAKLKQFIDEVAPLKTVIAGGDKNSSMVLYDKDVILPIFTDITNSHDLDGVLMHL